MLFVYERSVQNHINQNLHICQSLLNQIQPFSVFAFDRYDWRNRWGWSPTGCQIPCALRQRKHANHAQYRDYQILQRRCKTGMKTYRKKRKKPLNPLISRL